MPGVSVVVSLDGFADPAGAFVALARSAEDVFWLDAGADAREGWSFLGAGTRTDDDAALRAQPVGRRATGDEVPSHDAGPFAGGWVGWLGYEDGAEAAGAPIAHPDDAVPGSAWMRADRWIAFDHASRRMWAVSRSDPGWPASARELLAQTAPEPVQVPFRTVVGRHTPLQYAALIGRCHDAIRAGDAYQLCLTTRFTLEAAIDPVEVYLRLRATSRTGLGAFIRIGEVSVCSATPERFLRVEGDVVRTRPIKGTRPRSSDASEDASLAAELVASEKERAENVMIVDLMRNDLSRVCATGSVRVDALLAVESYPHVHQLVSTVSGRLRDDVTVGDLLRVAFPAGSMTGAPKLSAMTILHELERGPRGVFAGCLGWIGGDGDLDLAMVIRTVVITPARAYVGAGGGITWSSHADDEVREVAVKARAPLAAIGAELPPGW